MKLKALTAAGIAVLTLIAGVGLQSQSASATTPPGQDHAFHVTLSQTVVGLPVTLNVDLTLCTNGNGVGGTANECVAGTADAPFFDQATANFKGILVNGAQTVGARTGSTTFDIETNAGTIEGAGPNAGQRKTCGTTGTHLAPPAFDVWVANKTGTVVSMDPSGTPPFSIDQLDDPAEPNGGDVPQGNGWPVSIKEVPVVIGSVKTLAGIPDAAVINRGTGVAVVVAGVTQTSVNFLTISTGGSPGTVDAIANLTLLGNPLGVASPVSQSTTTCPPFFSSVTSLGTNLPSAGSKSISGAVLTGATDRTVPVIGGQANNTICSVGCVAGYNYGILLSATGDDDTDGINNTEDNCPTVPNFSQVGRAGIGTACLAGEGYDNDNATALSNLAAPGCVSTPTTCTDIDSDGYLNAADNCPFVANGTAPDDPGGSNQKNNDGDGRGDACEGTGLDPTVAPKNNPIASVKGNGDGYTNGRLPGVTTSGQVDDHSDICQVAFTTGSAVAVTPATVCLAFGPGDSPPGPGFAWQDSNNDGVPDFLCAGACTSGLVSRDHKSDANGDGYSDADQGTPANCAPAASCASILTSGGSTSGTTAETFSCQNAGKSCGTGAQSTWDPLRRAKNAPGGPGTGCLKTLDEVGAAKTLNLAKGDVDLDNSVSILDLSKLAGWFGNDVGDQTDPRWEGNLDGDGSISILDLSAVAANFGRNVDGTCAIL